MHMGHGAECPDQEIFADGSGRLQAPGPAPSQKYRQNSLVALGWGKVFGCSIQRRGIAMPGTSRLIIALLFSFLMETAAEERRVMPEKDDAFLGKNVTLVFHLEDSEKHFSVSTAKTSYRLHSTGETAEENHSGKKDEDKVSPDHQESHHQERHGVEFRGEVSLNNDLNRVLVTCSGQFYFSFHESSRSGTRVSEHAEEVEFEIDASALLTPGEPKPLVRSGPHVLTVTVTVEE